MIYSQNAYFFFKRFARAACKIGRSTRFNIFNFPEDDERMRLGGGANPPYGDPNRWEQANWGWGGKDVKYGALTMALGGRVHGAGATDPGGIVGLQLHETAKVDDSKFTIFSRNHATGSAVMPFTTYTNDSPWSGTSTNTGVVSEWMTGIPKSTGLDTQIDWSQLEATVSATTRRPKVEPTVIGGNFYISEMPGNSQTSKVIYSIADNSTTPITEFMKRGEVTDPTHNGYYIPPKTSRINSRDVPINRNGEIWRGTARAQDTIGKLADEVKYFTLRNPTLNTDSTR